MARFPLVLLVAACSLFQSAAATAPLRFADSHVHVVPPTLTLPELTWIDENAAPVREIKIPTLIFAADDASWTSTALDAGLSGLDILLTKQLELKSALQVTKQRTALRKGSRAAASPKSFLQSKFSLDFARKSAVDMANQVRRAFDSSLAQLGVESLGAFVLHLQSEPQKGDTKAIVAAWQEMERIYAAGGARVLGVSGFHLLQLEALITNHDISVWPIDRSIRLWPPM